jgi:transposase
MELDKVSKIYKIPIRTIYNWRQKYNLTLFTELQNVRSITKNIKTNIERPPNKEYKCLLTDEIKNYIDNYVSKKPYINMRKFRKLLERKFKLSIANSTIYKWFEKLHITYKKINKKKTYVHKQKEKMIGKLFNQINNFPDKNNIISIDESHFEINMTNTRGWGKSGLKIYNKSLNKKKLSISLLMAISKNKTIGFFIKQGPVNATDFTEFIKSINKDYYVYLMDNARIHHSKIFNKYMESTKSSVIYNVPYNPETNPIEQVFSKLKNDITIYNTSDIKNLKEAIAKSIKKVKCIHLNNFYKKSLQI